MRKIALTLAFLIGTSPALSQQPQRNLEQILTEMLTASADIHVKSEEIAIQAFRPCAGKSSESEKLQCFLDASKIVLATLKASADGARAYLKPPAGAGSATTQRGCLFTKENVAAVYQGAAIDSVERAIGCKLSLQSSHGGDFGREVYEAVGTDGARFVAFMGKSKRLEHFSYYPR